MLHGHGDHVEADDTCDEQIQIMAGAHLVDQEAEAGVIRIVGLALCFCSGGRRAERHIKSFLCVLLKSMRPHFPDSKDDKFYTDYSNMLSFSFFRPPLLACYHF